MSGERLKVLVTGKGLLAQAIERVASKRFIVKTFSREELDIKHFGSVDLVMATFKPQFVIHTAALTKPMSLHEQEPNNSIETNIIGTSNVVMSAMRHNKKLIYISTDYVYPNNGKLHMEDEPLLPINKYAWSKLGGECAVRLYDNSLIIRTTFTESPFPHGKAYGNIYRNMMYVDDVAKKILEVMYMNGVVNIGSSKIKSIYEFAKETKPEVQKVECKDESIPKKIILDVLKSNDFDI